MYVSDINLCKENELSEDCSMDGKPKNVHKNFDLGMI
jgi:hypothetical protein